MGFEELRQKSVGAVVAEDERTADVFHRFGVDYCCGGARTLEAACADHGVDFEAVVRALTELEEARDGAPASQPLGWALDDLVRHIVETHHAYVRETLPVLMDSAARVLSAHGARHPELRAVRELISVLDAEMREHMEAEESGIFPRITALVAATGSDAMARGPSNGSGSGAGADTAADGPDPDSLRAAIDELEGDHDRAGNVMRELRGITEGFDPPADACATFRSLYSHLQAFESDLHRHVHLENNVLFPRALSLEDSTQAATEATRW